MLLYKRLNTKLYFGGDSTKEPIILSLMCRYIFKKILVKDQDTVPAFLAPGAELRSILTRQCQTVMITSTTRLHLDEVGKHSR